MSLTAFVRHKTPIRARMALDFPRPKLRLNAELRVPSVSPNRALMGTAFDYLFRFHLQRKFPFAVTRTWVAERAHRQLVDYGRDGMKIWTGKGMLDAGEVCESMGRFVRRAQQLLAEFLAGEPLSTALLRAALNLAHCDPFYRVGLIDERFGKPTAAQVQELKRLMAAVDWSQFQAKRICLLNPTFGAGSPMIGGADADLLLDDLLVEVKTTSTLKIRTEDWRQLIAYAALNEHFPIGDGKRRVPIRRLGFYFSRHGYLVTWPLAELVDQQKFIAFAAWLRTYIRKIHAARLARRKRVRQKTKSRIRERTRRGKRSR
jgi:hypothetical protein